MEIKWNKSIEDLKKANYKQKDKIYFTCSKCNKIQSLFYKTVISRDIFICRACRGIETQLKIKKENPNYGWLAHSKDASWFKSEEFKEKRNKTMNERYGVEYTLRSDILREKVNSTMVKMYGEDYQKTVFQEKRKHTNLQRYGVEFAGFQDEKSKEKSKITCLKKYGVEHTAQVTEIRKKQRRKYKVNNICFDSMPEIYFYFWLKDNNIEFSYNGKYPKTYIDKNNKEHYYFYDFKIGERYIELKGDCFFNENNEPISRYIKRGCDWSDKYNFLINENVEIIKTGRIIRGDLKYIKDNFYTYHKMEKIER